MQGKLHCLWYIANGKWLDFMPDSDNLKENTGAQVVCASLCWSNIIIHVSDSCFHKEIFVGFQMVQCIKLSHLLDSGAVIDPTSIKTELVQVHGVDQGSLFPLWMDLDHAKNFTMFPNSLKRIASWLFSINACNAESDLPS